MSSLAGSINNHLIYNVLATIFHTFGFFGFGLPSESNDIFSGSNSSSSSSSSGFFSGSSSKCTVGSKSSSLDVPCGGSLKSYGFTISISSIGMSFSGSNIMSTLNMGSIPLCWYISCSVSVELLDSSSRLSLLMSSLTESR